MTSVKSEEEVWGEHKMRLENIKKEYWSMYEEKKEKLEQKIESLESEATQKAASFEKFIMQAQEELLSKLGMLEENAIPIIEEPETERQKEFS